MSRLLSNIIYLIGERFLLLLINLVSNIVIIRYLGVKDFGLLALFQVYYALVISISEFGVRRVYSSLKSTRRESIVFLQTFKFKSVAAIFLGFLICALIKSFNLSNVYFLLLLAVLASPLELYVYHFEANLENATLVRLRLVINVSLSFLRIALCLLGADVFYIVATYAINNMIINGFCFYLSRLKDFSIISVKSRRANSIISRHILDRSLFFWISMIIVQVNMRTDQLMLSAFTTVTAVGIYAGAYKLIEQLMSIPSVLASVFLPYMSKAVNQNKKESLENLYLYSILITIPISVLLVIIAPYLIPLLLGNEFINSVSVFQLLAIAFPFLVIANFSGLYYSMFMLEKLAIFRNTMGLVISLVCNYFFIKVFGPVGAAISVIFSFFFIAFVAEFLVPGARDNVYMKYRALLRIFKLSTYSNLLIHARNAKRQ